MKKDKRDTYTFILLLLGIFLVASGYNNYTTTHIVEFTTVTIYVVVGIIFLAIAYFLQKRAI
jgi:hypothetical protein